MSAVDRRAIGDALSRLAFAAELLGVDAAVVDAAAASALSWSLRQLEGDVSFERIAALPEASVPLLAVIDDVMHGREPPLLVELESRVPTGLLEVRRLKGLGPKKIRALWRELDVTSVGELEYACQENRLVGLKGFGKKTQDSVLEQIETLRAQAGLVRLDQALVLAATVIKELARDGAIAALAGEVRRGLEVTREILVITTAPLERARAALALFGGEVSIDGARAKTRAGPVEVVVDSCVPQAIFGARLLLATGSTAHVAALRARAADRGLVLDDIEGDEDEVYAALALLPVAPERREDGVPLVEKGKARPKLIRRADLQGALHNHTTESDGTASLREMRDAAAARGLRYLGITDHSQSAVYAKGLAAQALANQRKEIAGLNAERDAGQSGCVILAGVESDIKKDGALDYDDDVLRALEVVVASVHARFGQKGADLTARMVAAARHPLTDVVGHPTGRLLLGRAPSEFDVAALLDACVASGCAVELNANPARLDLNELHLSMAKERRIPISIAADAHSTGALDHLDFGVTIARRAGLLPEDVLNARGLEDLRGWLSARRVRAGAGTG